MKALAAQLIVWHHLASYGPMSDVVAPHAPVVFDFLYRQARIAVQVFLVVGGFLAARSLAERWRGIEANRAGSWPGLPALIGRRYVRLIRPYALALAAAILCAALARAWTPEPSVPSPPAFGQFVAHLVLVQDILGFEALSAGVWYVAIDFQLYLLLLVIVAIGRRTDPRLAPGLVLALACASLFWWNRLPVLDSWGIYFFGAYGSGALAYWVSAQAKRCRWLLLLALLIVAALIVEWRTRIAVAGAVALLLAATADPGRVRRWPRSWSAAVRALGDISYCVFLIHYPALLLAGAVAFRWWPHSVGANAAGMVAAWLLSLAAGAALHRTVEAGARSRTSRAT